MNTNNKRCTAELISITQAQKAQRALASAVIPSEIIKISGSANRKGCTYGISFECRQKNNVIAVLSAAGISVKRWNETD